MTDTASAALDERVPLGPRGAECEGWEQMRDAVGSSGG